MDVGHRPSKRNSAVAADVAAFVSSKTRPRPLPLPPGLTLADLPKLTRKTGRLNKLNGVNARSRDCVEPIPAKTPEVSNSDKEDVVTQILEGEKLDLGAACANADEENYLWKTKSDEELARSVAHCLSDFDTLMAECDALFDECASRYETDSWIFVEPGALKRVTQQLINQLGSRSQTVLRRILVIYTATALSTDEAGLDRVKFRGYIASVLTQILRELEDRDGLEAEEDQEEEDEEEEEAEEEAPKEEQGLLQAVNVWIDRVAEAIAGIRFAWARQPQDQEEPPRRERAASWPISWMWSEKDSVDSTASTTVPDEQELDPISRKSTAALSEDEVYYYSVHGLQPDLGVESKEAVREDADLSNSGKC